MATVSDQVLTDISKALQQSQRDMINQDNFFFGTGDVTLTKMDSTTTKIFSLAKILGVVDTNLSNGGSLGTLDLNSLDGLKEGKYHQPTTANVTTARHYPKANAAGVLLVYQVGLVSSHSCLQLYITAEAAPDIYFRFGSATSSTATAATWSGWNELKTSAAGGTVPVTEGGTGAGDAAGARKNIGLDKVSNLRQLPQYLIADNPGTGSLWIKIATIKDPASGTAQLDLMVTGGIDSGEPNHYVDFVFINGRGYTAQATAAAAAKAKAGATAADKTQADSDLINKLMTVRRLGPIGQDSDNAPIYGIVQANNSTFDVYLQKVPYATIAQIAVLHEDGGSTVSFHGEGYAKTSTAPTGFIKTSPRRVYDSGNTPFGSGAGQICQGNDSRLGTINAKSGGAINGDVTVNGKLAITRQTPLAHTANATKKTGVFLGENTIWGYGTGEYSGNVKGSEARTLQFVGMLSESSKFSVETFGADILNDHLEYRGVIGKGNGDYKVFTYRHDNGDFTIQGQFHPASDIRMKRDFKPITNPLKGMLSIRGTTYIKKDSTSYEVGILAQDVEKICPIAVSHRAHDFADGSHINDLKTLNISGVTAAYSVEAMKETIRLMRLCLTDPAAALEKLDELCANINDEQPQDFGGEEWQR
ncbi:hypothetical protein SB5439_04977 [Klebsiella variicola]|uniref:pyocin knob domain-containing S74 family peptidase n=1 Tax=Klebsiella variicola TaxID=244366 RepID=UPI00109C17F4|nr:pyocin knob domain-containing S74 family peptidase [Klebsiella variicola]VGQ11643.1 hypothetical protein SB5439_04977 [Klebsiella variicola]